uniref:D-amino acid oxidase n=1 Tax=Nothoprocta perdicaria TaxID=30464 RepID=A0A8C6Z8C7_NOTPE
MRVAVVGAGVAGLSTALCVLEQCGPRAPALQLAVHAERLSPRTASDGAVGLWQPYALHGRGPQETLWNKETFEYLLGHVGSPEAEEMGLFLVSGYNLFKEPVPLWLVQHGAHAGGQEVFALAHQEVSTSRRGIRTAFSHPFFPPQK